MSDAGALPYRAALEEYEKEAQALFEGWKRHDEASEWRCKWEHPGFRGKSVREVRVKTLALADAQVVIPE